MPATPDDFRARPPWWGGDLQTLRNFAVRVAVDLSAWPCAPLLFPMADGSGDRLLGFVHRLDAPTRPTVLLVHGLAGSSESSYMRGTAAHLLGQGHQVVRLNLRGAGASRALCKFQYHAGRTEDLATVIAALPAGLVRDGVCVVGYSLGGNAVLKLVGEERALPVRAAASVSAPIDLSAAAHRFLAPRNYLYHRWMLARMKREAMSEGASITEQEREAVLSAESVIQFDDRFVAPRNGFANAADYYARCSALGFLGTIRVPSLLIHADDDPWIPASAYRGWDWRSTPALTPALTRGGGHVGYHAAGDAATWYDRRIAAFFA
ncbi:MAG: alpha/beta fold hydrolase [Rhodospirillales bacterium]|nr:alpha/beta fold hydrolase [Rhodospirillales bacterium]